MQTQTLQAEVRENSGKGPARQLRMRGLIPAVFYGPGIDTINCSVSPEALSNALRGEYRRNQLLELDFSGDKKLAVLKDLAVDPLTRYPLHADFYAVDETRPVETTVPFHSTGRALGVQKGGTLKKFFRELSIRALPHKVPAHITVDVSDLDIDTAVTVADLKLEDGVEVTLPATRRVLFIDFKEAREEDEETEDGEAEQA